MVIESVSQRLTPTNRKRLTQHGLANYSRIPNRHPIVTLPFRQTRLLFKWLLRGRRGAKLNADSHTFLSIGGSEQPMRNAGFALVPLVLAIAGSLAFVQRVPRRDQTLTGSAAYRDWRSDRPGIRRRIGIDDMPSPMATEAATSLPIVVKRPDEASPKVPPGFTAELFVSGLTGPRVVRTAARQNLPN